MFSQHAEYGVVDFPVLLQALHSRTAEWDGVRTVMLFVDTRPLEGLGQPAYWRDFSPWVRERCRSAGPHGETAMAAHFPATRQLGLDKVHYTWTGTFVLEAAVFLFPDINFILSDADCVPLALFEVAELENLAALMFPENKRDSARGFILMVSEPYAEINAGWVCRSTTTRPT